MKAQSNYFVFQGVVFTSTSSAFKLCHSCWIPLSLSLLAATLNLFAIIDNAPKILNSREELDQNKADLALMRLHGMTRAQIISQVLPHLLLLVLSHINPTCIYFVEELFEMILNNRIGLKCNSINWNIYRNQGRLSN